MALVRWNPNGRRESREDIDYFLEDFFGPRYRPWWYGRERVAPTVSEYSPRVDVVNAEESVILTAEVPGIERDDLDISVTDDLVTIKGERKEASQSENECFYCRETTSGTFERQVRLPENVVADKAEAKLRNGVLTLTLPKAEPQGSFKVEVN